MRSYKEVSTVIIGAGHAGLSFSRKLHGLAIDHVVLEQGDIANSWKNDRWDSLKLLTPNYKFSLPEFKYEGNNPQGFMGKDDVATTLSRYASTFNAPVCANTKVLNVQRVEAGYKVVTTSDTWICQTLVLANGAFSQPVVPTLARAIPMNILNMHSKSYKNPSQLVPGKVLVVGASSSGLQLAEELNRSGFDVTISVGEHVRVPRSYRGKDIFWWLDRSKIATETTSDQVDIKRLNRLPSPQLIGASKTQMFDLNYLADSGIRLVGKLSGLSAGRFQFSGSLNNICKLADLKLNRLLHRFDSLNLQDVSDIQAVQRFAATRTAKSPLSIPCADFKNVIWATGLKPDYTWLDVPVVDAKGHLIQSNGVVASPGMYAVGLPSMIRRQSSYIHGIESDVEDLSVELANYLYTSTRRARYA